MYTPTPTELAEILAKHAAWLRGDSGDKRADLAGANLAGANLTGANLSGANLSGANLFDANLSRATLETGETYETYLAETVPQLLLAAERGVAAIQAWGKKTWDDCPMAVAFNVHSESETPTLLRPRVRQFVLYYDAGLIPQPTPEQLSRAALAPMQTYQGDQEGAE